jgi:hypothetical protein
LKEQRILESEVETFGDENYSRKSPQKEPSADLVSRQI